MNYGPNLNYQPIFHNFGLLHWLGWETGAKNPALGFQTRLAMPRRTPSTTNKSIQHVVVEQGYVNIQYASTYLTSSLVKY